MVAVCVFSAGSALRMSGSMLTFRGTESVELLLESKSQNFALMTDDAVVAGAGANNCLRMVGAEGFEPPTLCSQI